jgi:hypothetical protein
MPRAARITAELVAEVAARRDLGEPWKSIMRDMASRGLPNSVSSWIRADVALRRDAGDAPAPRVRAA